MKKTLRVIVLLAFVAYGASGCVPPNNTQKQNAISNFQTWLNSNPELAKYGLEVQDVRMNGSKQIADILFDGWVYYSIDFSISADGKYQINEDFLRSVKNHKRAKRLWKTLGVDDNSKGGDIKKAIYRKIK